MYVKLKSEKQTAYSVWENVLLIRADSDDEAFLKAELRGKSEEGDDDGSFRWGGKPASWVFAGVRKLTTIDDEIATTSDDVELTFLEFELASIKDVEKLAAGEPVRLLLNDRFRPEPVAKSPRRKRA